MNEPGRKIHQWIHPGPGWTRLDPGARPLQATPGPGRSLAEDPPCWILEEDEYHYSYKADALGLSWEPGRTIQGDETEGWRDNVEADRRKQGGVGLGLVCLLIGSCLGKLLIEHLPHRHPSRPL